MTNYNSLSDEELVAFLRESDKAAYKEIFLRYDKLLYLFAFRKLRSQEDAKDVVQEVFSWLWKNRTQLPKNMIASSYLYRSALNKTFDIFRRKDIFQEWINRGEYFYETENNNTDHLIREKDIRLVIEREIEAMPERMREIYELKRIHDLSIKEIAEKLQISEHTVSTHLKRAMKRLRIRLGLLAYILFILYKI